MIEVDAVPRWLLVIALVLLFVGFVAYARGREHHRGPQQVGAIALSAASVPSVQLRSHV